ncbi:DUF7059 domain-containing protein [Arthrobacter sp. 35W]|uniref:DUF7059 domain-containing protein n=1 Tax=Arthrobacter sp. 35W TaxID=1132441 RepID=UPI000412D7D6|nr:methyltransferase [Arthrobacter sp. 35W]
MTDFSHIPDAPRSDHPELLRALAADLSALDYTVDGVETLLGAEAYAAFGRDQTVPASLKLKHDGGPLATVVKLWLLAQPVDHAAIEAALPTLGVDGLLELGLAEYAHQGATLSASVDLRPYGWPADADGAAGADLWVASDLAAHQRPGVLRKDHVLGIGQASLTLAQGTIRRHVDRALDLGTGCGIQTFHLLHHARIVVATDISERALAFTRFNLLLNAAELGLKAEDFDPANPDARISLRLGSLLEPVAGEEFDLVVSNPPFVITPRRRGEGAADQFTYRDGGLPGDDIVATLVRTLPTVLAPGGTAQMLGNWEIYAAGEGTAAAEGTAAQDGAPSAWHSRPASWLADGTEAWFLQREMVGPGQYAETWLQDASEARDAAHYEESYADYLDDFASRNVAGIGFGYIWLRRPESALKAGAAIRRFEEILYPIEQPVGPHLAAAVERADWVGALDPDSEGLAGEYLVVAEDVTEERHQKPGAEHPGVILLRQGAGLRRTNLLSTELAGFVSASDGELTAGQIVGALAMLLERDDAGFAHDLLEDVRNLVLEGFLLPA